MRLLLDTHTLLWWHDQPSGLSKAARAAIGDESTDVFISVVNAWEMQIKAQLGKLTLPTSLTDIINQERRVNGFQVLPVTMEHVYALDALPLHHKDPFDRLLIAQARQEGLTLVSHDTPMKAYDVAILW